ncbi:MAG: hypothetical protein WBC44_19990 [Planctomycetaceae bacterium]
MNAKMGRPPKTPDERRVETIRVPLTEAEKAVIDTAAERDGAKVTTWAREALLKAAKKRAASGERGSRTRTG